MEHNIITTILNIATFKDNDLKEYSSNYLNRINAAGEQLEFFIKDAIAGTFREKQESKEEKYSKVFSYLGNQNNPPDIIIKNSDALEIKKIESPKSTIALNSSPPKDVLDITDERITSACKLCEKEPWKEKELFYVIGFTKKNKLKYIFFIQGKCYAADKKVYGNLYKMLKHHIDFIFQQENIESSNTKEIGKVKRVDPLGITTLRLRGMWHILNPMQVYKNVCKIDESKDFSLFALLTKEKYDSFPKTNILNLESHKEILVEDIKIKNPNNITKLIDAKLIKFSF